MARVGWCLQGVPESQIQAPRPLGIAMIRPPGACWIGSVHTDRDQLHENGMTGWIRSAKIGVAEVAAVLLLLMGTGCGKARKEGDKCSPGRGCGEPGLECVSTNGNGMCVRSPARAGQPCNAYVPCERDLACLGDPLTCQTGPAPAAAWEHREHGAGSVLSLHASARTESTSTLTFYFGLSAGRVDVFVENMPQYSRVFVKQHVHTVGATSHEGYAPAFGKFGRMDGFLATRERFSVDISDVLWGLSLDEITKSKNPSAIMRFPIRVALRGYAEVATELHASIPMEFALAKLLSSLPGEDSPPALGEPGSAPKSERPRAGCILESAANSPGSLKYCHALVSGLTVRDVAWVARYRESFVRSRTCPGWSGPGVVVDTYDGEADVYDRRSGSLVGSRRLRQPEVAPCPGPRNSYIAEEDRPFALRYRPAEARVHEWFKQSLLNGRVL